MTYSLEYEGYPLATVTIPETPRVEAAIKEMVEFWMGWEERLEDEGDDYHRVWLKDLAMYLLRNEGDTPSGKEGWVHFNEFDIVVDDVFPHEFYREEIAIL